MRWNGHNGPCAVIKQDKISHIYGYLFLSRRIETVSPGKHPLFHREICCAHKGVHPEGSLHEFRNFLLLGQPLHHFLNHRVFGSKAHKGCPENRILSSGENLNNLI